MASNIDPTLPAEGVPAVKADLRNNLQAAHDEIEALQAAEVPTGGTTGQVLAKNSGTNYDMGWADESSGAGSYIMPTYNVAADTTYTAADFSTAPVYISADGSQVGGGITITFPDPADFNLGTNEARLIAYVASITSDPVGIACAASTKIRSQPGTPGWNSNQTLVLIGATVDEADEAIVQVLVSGRSGTGVMSVIGLVR